ncbi:MAG: RNA polymerase sigma factor [Chitinophagaceae bacterium]
MIEAIQQGNENAFEQAYVLHREKIYFYFLKKTKSCEDAKDLLQTTFLKLWRYRKSLSPDFLLEQHLFQIARTVFIDYLRKQNKHSELLNTLTKNPNNFSYTIITSEFDTAKNLHSALSSMPALRKKIFELIRLQGYSYKEVAALLSISLKSVDNNLTKALKQLRKISLIFILFFMHLF